MNRDQEFRCSSCSFPESVADSKSLHFTTLLQSPNVNSSGASNETTHFARTPSQWEYCGMRSSWTIFSWNNVNPTQLSRIVRCAMWNAQTAVCRRRGDGNLKIFVKTNDKIGVRNHHSHRHGIKVGDMLEWLSLIKYGSRATNCTSFLRRICSASVNCFDIRISLMTHLIFISIVLIVLTKSAAVAIVPFTLMNLNVLNL